MIKFINPLPISEEMLGAYLEGNLSVEDSAKVESLLDSDASFREFVDDVTSLELDPTRSIYNEYPNFDLDFQLPELPNELSGQPDIIDNVIDFTSVLNNSFGEVAACAFSDAEVAAIQEEPGLDDMYQFDCGEHEGVGNENIDPINDNLDL